jgi:hypothetical protein
VGGYLLWLVLYVWQFWNVNTCFWSGIGTEGMWFCSIGPFGSGPQVNALTWQEVVPHAPAGGRKRGGVNRSAAERQLARASKEHARAQRDLKEYLCQKLRRQRRQAREVVKREVERLFAEHEEQRRRLRLPPLSPEQREAVIYGFRQRVTVPSDDGSMPWSDVQVLQDRLRGADDALERAHAEAAQHKEGFRLRDFYAGGDGTSRERCRKGHEGELAVGRQAAPWLN